MMDLALSVLALLAGGLALELYSRAWATPKSRAEHRSLLGSEARTWVTNYLS